MTFADEFYLQQGTGLSPALIRVRGCLGFKSAILPPTLSFNPAIMRR